VQLIRALLSTQETKQLLEKNNLAELKEALFNELGDDGLDVFELLIPSALDPGQKLLDRPVIGGSCVSVPDRDRKKLEELFPG